MRRRDFLGAAAVAAGSAATGPVRASVASRKVAWVYDAAALKGVDATGLFPSGAAPRAIEGDRVRFASALLAERPHEIRGVTRYADYLLLSGAAAEAGYRVVSRANLDSGALSWAIRRR